MKVLSLIGQKGGSGKTTLAVHLAVAAHESDVDVLLVDADPQGSATTWGNARTAESPIVATVAGSELARVLAAAQGEGIDLVIVDTAPHAAPEAARTARASNLVLIPCRPTAFDVAAAGAAARITQAANVASAFVLSACPARAPEIAESRAALVTYGLPVAPTEISELRAYFRACATGQAVTEFEDDGKAADEIRALWKWTREMMA